MSKLKLLLEISFRNLFSSGMNLIIGFIIFAGTLLVVVGGAVMGSVDAAMSKSIIGSAAGHIQVYSARSKEDVAIFGQMTGEADLQPIDDFSKLKKTVSAIENVDTVVPMGINGALITSGNTIDVALEKLRDVYRSGDNAPGQREKGQSLKAHVRRMVTLLEHDLKNVQTLSTENAIEPRALQALAKAASETFWAKFDEDPLGSLEFLENEVAPLGADSDLLYLHYVGTDLEQFQKSFDRMRVVDGRAVPPGHRGLLLSKFFYEDQLKLKTARRMDLLHEGMVEKGKKIAEDTDLQRLVKENRTQTREILYQLDSLRAAVVTEKLQRSLESTEADLGKLLEALLDVNDDNFLERYSMFYQDVAPSLDLYRIRIGDVLTIKAFTRAGYIQSVNAKVYGTFNFSGLEKSPLAGSMNLLDLMSFRDLYGYLSADRLAEIQQMKEASGSKIVDRESAEDALFGQPDAGKQVTAVATPGVFETELPKGASKALRNQDLAEQIYPKEELQKGVVLSAAVLLKNPDRLQATMDEILAQAERDGLPLKVASWQQASGLVGQFVLVAKLVLYFAVFIIFLVVLLIMNNAMMMATLQRVQEIGTLRAIGAQRRFVLTMVLFETLLLGLLFGAIGSAVGTGVVQWLSATGIPAGTDYLYFFFSGPRLYPTLGPGNLIAAFVIIISVSAISTLYPAFLAARVPPVRAMQTEE